MPLYNSAEACPQYYIDPKVEKFIIASPTEQQDICDNLDHLTTNNKCLDKIENITWFKKVWNKFINWIKVILYGQV